MNISEYISSGIVEQYVMGLCSPEEKKELDELRRKHPELNKAIADFEIELEERMQKDSVIPSPATDESILKSLDALHKPVMQTPVIEISKHQKKRKSTWPKVFAVAASLMIIACSYFIYSLSNETQKLKQEIAGLKNNPVSLPAADYKILNDPTITPVAMYGVGTHAICRCTMFWDKKTGKLYIIIHHLPKSSSSKDYQLWAMVDDKPVSVGIIQDEIRGRFIEMQNVPSGATAFTVTLENAGGSSTPTIEETYLSGRI